MLSRLSFLVRALILRVLKHYKHQNITFPQQALPFSFHVHWNFRVVYRWQVKIYARNTCTGLVGKQKSSVISRATFASMSLCKFRIKILLTVNGPYFELACEQALELGVWVFVGGGGGSHSFPSPHPLPQTKTQTPSSRACSQANFEHKNRKFEQRDIMLIFLRK